MKMCMQKFVDKIKAEPMVFAIGLCVLLLAVMGTSVRHVSSTMFGVLFLLSFSVIQDWKKIYFSLSRLEKIFLFSFLLYTIAGLLSYYNVDDVDKYYKLLERYLRFSLIIPVYFLIIKKNVSILNYLYLGAIVSGPFLFFIALQHYLADPDVPAKGYYHHIIFGQLAMLNVGIMLSVLLTKNLNRLVQVLILISMLGGLAAAVMSQARGAWLVFPVYIMIAIYCLLKEKRISANKIVIFLAVMIFLTIFTPIGDLVGKRTEMAITEVSNFYSEGQYVSSVGTRLAMWDIAINVWKQQPMLGTGPGDFDDEIITLQNKGEYIGMDVHNSTHNIYFQALVDLGIVGLAALLFVVLIMPLRLILYGDNINTEGRLVGFITVISFAVFGLSESWTLRLSSISVFLVYVIVIATHIHIFFSKDKNI